MTENTPSYDEGVRKQTQALLQIIDLSTQHVHEFA